MKHSLFLVLTPVYNILGKIRSGLLFVRYLQDANAIMKPGKLMNSLGNQYIYLRFHWKSNDNDVEQVMKKTKEI